MNPLPRLPARQRGAVLYVALVFLVVLSLLGITGMQVSMLQERMASNYRATNIAFQRAESEARDKEADIETVFKAGGMFVSNQERCDPAFDPVGWAADQAAESDPEMISRTRRIDRCTPGGSLGTGVRPESERTDQMFQVTAFAPDMDASASSNAAIDTIFIP